MALVRAAWVSVGGCFLTAACVQPEEGAPINPPPGAQTMILVAQGPREPQIDVFGAPFPTRYSRPVDATLQALFYRCPEAALQLGGEGAHALPLPETEAGQRLDGDQWRPLGLEAVQQVRAESPVPRRDLGCTNLTLRRQLHQRTDQGMSAAAWLEPGRGVLVVLDDRGNLWRADPRWEDGDGAEARFDPILPLDLHVTGIAYSKLAGRAWGFGQDKVSGDFVTFSLGPDGTLTREAEQPGLPDPTLADPEPLTRIAFSDASPPEAFVVGNTAMVSRYQDGRWSQIAPGHASWVQTGLVVLGPGRLLVAGQCDQPSNALDRDVLGCRDLARLDRQADGSWRPTSEILPPLQGWVSALAQDGSGAVYGGTRMGELVVRAPNGVWTQLAGTGGLGRIEYLAALPEGAVAALDGGGLYRVGGPAGRCPPVPFFTEHRALFTFGADFALLGETRGGMAVDGAWGSAGDEDCRLPLLPQGE